MVIVNKILNVLIFLLAIAACIAAILLHQRRQELRGRADYLAKIIADVATKVDGPGETSSEIDSTKGEDGIVPDLLTWETYHKSRKYDEAKQKYIFTDWEAKLDKIVGHTETLFTLKVKMAENFTKIQQTIKMDLATLATKEGNNEIKNEGEPLTAAEYLQALNSHNSFEDMVWKIPEKIERVTGRGLRLATELAAITKNIGPGKEQSVDNFNIFSDADDKENAELDKNLKIISAQASDLYSRSQVLAKGYGNIVKSFDADPDNQLPQFYEPKFNPNDVMSEDQGTINSAVEVFKNDLREVNKLLHDRVVTQGLLEKARGEIARKDTTIEELNGENDFLKNENGRVVAANTKLSRELENLKEIYVKGRNNMKPGFSAKVIEANDRFDFIILDKGKKDGVKNLVEMVVHSNGTYVCKVLVTKVLENQCVCDILPITRPVDAKGNFILPSTGDEAVVPGN
jgi:hypothetical protein